MRIEHEEICTIKEVGQAIKSVLQKNRGASFCTSNTSSVPPKVTIIPFIKIQLRVGKDAVNEIYCVANFCTPKYYFLSVCISFTLPSFKISLILVSCGPFHSPQLSILWASFFHCPVVVVPFGGLYHFHSISFKFILSVSQYLTVSQCLSVYRRLLKVILFEERCYRE